MVVFDFGDFWVLLEDTTAIGRGDGFGQGLRAFHGMAWPLLTQH